MIDIKADNKKRYVHVEGGGSVRDMAIEFAAAANHIYQGFKQNNMHDVAKWFITALRAYINDVDLMEAPMDGGALTVLVEQRGEHA